MKIFLLIRTRNIQMFTLILVVSPGSGNTYRHDDFDLHGVRDFIIL